VRLVLTRFILLVVAEVGMGIPARLLMLVEASEEVLTAQTTHKMVQLSLVEA